MVMMSYGVAETSVKWNADLVGESHASTPARTGYEINSQQHDAETEIITRNWIFPEQQQ